jgi:hypothetical protein
MYKEQYLAYMTTGIKTSFVNAMNNETNADVLATLNQKYLDTNQ